MHFQDALTILLFGVCNMVWLDPWLLNISKSGITLNERLWNRLCHVSSASRIHSTIEPRECPSTSY